MTNVRAPKILRIIPELRNYHVAHDRLIADSDTYYFTRKYDMVGDIPSTIRRISFLRLLKVALFGSHAQLVIWEPLWVRLLPKHLLVVGAWKLGGVRRPVVSYAMENNDIPSLIAGRRQVPASIVRAFTVLIGRYIRMSYARLAYASDGARKTYESLNGVGRVTSTTIPNLPARASLVVASGQPNSVIMIANLERRKGTEIIMREWPKVEAVAPTAHLTIIGAGPEQHKVEEWASRRTASRAYLGPLAHADALKRVADASVLVLPSVREGRWREQIGLPIHEGLVHGLTIVTTDETGLADLLLAAGHEVVPVCDIQDEFGGAILRAITSPLDRHQVLESLPAIDGRIEANSWLTAMANK